MKPKHANLTATFHVLCFCLCLDKVKREIREAKYASGKMSGEEEDEEHNLDDLSERTLMSKSSDRYQVSGWDNDDDGIEQENQPHGN